MRGRRGFTLIEVLVATVVLAIVALVAFPTLLSFERLSDAAREENVATHDLAAAAEDLLATPFGALLADYPDGAAIPKYSASHLPGERIVVTYADPAGDPLLVTLVATWNDAQGRARTESHRCVRTR